MKLGAFSFKNEGLWMFFFNVGVSLVVVLLILLIVLVRYLRA
jgi:hypothetical protein